MPIKLNTKMEANNKRDKLNEGTEMAPGFI